MPFREVPLITDSYYHVLNRGVAKLPTYLDVYDYRHALLGLSYYRFSQPPMRLSQLLDLSTSLRRSAFDRLEESGERLVDIIAWCLMPNHFHLLLRQRVDGGISQLLRRWTDSYSRYFNRRHDRVGPLFQGVFKNVLVTSNEQLVHLSRYIHINAPVAGLTSREKLWEYPWSSAGEYEGSRRGFCTPEIVLDQFEENGYRRFVEDHLDYAAQLEAIKHLTLEE